MFTADRLGKETPETARRRYELMPCPSFAVFKNSAHLAMAGKTDGWFDFIGQSIQKVERRN